MSAHSPKLGILAGGGNLPKAIIESCQKSDRAFHVIAFDGHTSPLLVENVPHTWVRLGAAGRTVKILHDQDVKDLVMAGSIKRPSLFQLRPDLWAFKFFIKTGARSKGDDGLLRNLITALEKSEGFHIIGAEQLVQHLLIDAGEQSLTSANPQDIDDIKIAIQAALQLGAADLGQAVVARDGQIIAKEGKDGTDAMLLRLFKQAPQHRSGVLVKMPKPGQERRADLPAIGPETIKNVERAGLSGVALEAGGGFVLERDKVVHLLNENALFLRGIPPSTATDKDN